MGRQIKQWALVCMMLASTGLSSADQLSDANSAYDTGNYAKAMQLFMVMAKQGNALAEFNIGFMYANGQGVPQNLIEAYVWTHTAATNASDSDYQKQYADLRDSVAKKMTANQIVAAKNLAQKCASSKFKVC